MVTLKDAVKGTTANLKYVCAGVLYYTIFIKSETGDGEYQFPVDMNDKEDVGSTYFYPEYKAITLMRYIRKAMGNETFIKVS